MTRSKQGILFVTVLLATFFVFTLTGQAITERNYQGSLVTNVTPANPGPNENVFISLTSYETNLDQANIIWTVNGQEEKSGIGEKTFNFHTGESGSNYLIDIQVEADGKKILHKQLSFSFADIDMVWEAATYVPPFYQGHSLISQGSLIKLVAIPHIKDQAGKEIDSKELIYSWRRNNLSQPKYSGLGQNTLIFKNQSLAGADNLTVTVTTADKAITVSKVTTLYPSNPKVVFYPSAEGVVDFNNTFRQTTELKTGPLTLHAVPYFFSLSDNLPKSLTYEWKQNGAVLESSSDQPTELTFTASNGAKGVSNVQLSVKNKNILMQTATNNLQINFGQ